MGPEIIIVKGCRNTMSSLLDFVIADCGISLWVQEEAFLPEEEEEEALLPEEEEEEEALLPEVEEAFLPEKEEEEEDTLH